MDLFKLGLRSILGVTMPGTILVLIFLYTLFSVLYALNQPLTIFFWSKDHEFLILVVLFLVSYFLGSLMRLDAADNVDEESTKRLERYNIKKGYYKKSDETEFVEKRNQLINGGKTSEPSDREKTSELSDGFDKWLWAIEKFPYPNWQFRKFERYHPGEVSRFFESYRKCMEFDSGGRGKEFFNYCKMVIYHASQQLGAAVVEEVHFAEAIVRFYAGTYYGLMISGWMLVALFFFHAGVFIWFTLKGWGQPALTLKIINAIVTFTLIVAIFRMQQMIVHRFRTLRLKEVDTVYDVFYLIHRHPDDCTICKESGGTDDESSKTN